MSHPDQNLRHLQICVDNTKNSLFPTGNKLFLVLSTHVIKCRKF